VAQDAERGAARELEIDDELRALLGALRRACAADTPLIAELEIVADVERELGTVLPDDVLALSIARGLPLSRIVEQTASMDAFARTTHGLGAPFVVIETWGEWPATSVGFVRTQQRGPAQLQVWDWKKWTRWGDHPICGVAEFVRHHLGGDDAVPGSAIMLAPLPAADAFRPRLAAKPAAPQRFVTHAKFGRGEVLETLEGQHGKLRIAFADGERTVLAKFVTEA